MASGLSVVCTPHMSKGQTYQFGQCVQGPSTGCAGWCADAQAQGGLEASPLWNTGDNKASITIQGLDAKNCYIQVSQFEQITF